jgi:biopolymer transport protein ExbD
MAVHLSPLPMAPLMVVLMAVLMVLRPSRTVGLLINLPSRCPVSH